MKRKLRALLAAVMSAQLMLSGAAAVSVSAEDSNIGTAYEEPKSPAVTYNMNLDWKFYDTKGDSEIWASIAKADKDGKKFYEVGYDDSDWETVSIPHGIGGGNKSFASRVGDSGSGYRSVLLYRKTFTVPSSAEGKKIFFELEGIRQAAYVWVNGQKVGYYEAGITAMGFDLTKYVTPGQQAVIAIVNDGITARGTSGRIPYETVPGEEWGSSYRIDSRHGDRGNGVQYQWNTTDFNEPQIGLIYDAYLHVKGNVYQTLPLYNNLKTTGNYIYADNFDIKGKTATLHVDAEVRNESGADGNYKLEVNVVDPDGILRYSFESNATSVGAASDAGVVYETAVESDVYEGDHRSNGVGLTKVNTVDVTHITASYDATNLRFWNIDDPYLYTVYTVLKDSSGTVVDTQKKTTGFRKIVYSADDGLEINDRTAWLPGYAQRATNEWAIIGSANDWMNDWDMKLLKESNADFIRWMHVAPKPAQVRASDKYGVTIACPAGDKEGTAPTGRTWSQRTEAMRDAMIYFRNSPSVVFWETGNSPMGTAEKANEMAALRNTLDPYGMRFIGARSTNSSAELNYEYNYAGTMYGNYASGAVAKMKTNGIMGPIMETEYARDEAPRRVWDDYSPPDYDYVNKYLGPGGKKEDGYDIWDETQEDFSLADVKQYAGFYNSRVGGADGNNYYSAIAMMVWSDSNMHTRNAGSENCRTSGRVDPIRQTKDSYYAVRTAQSDTPAVDILGHWSYPAVSDDTYNYYAKSSNGKYEVYDTSVKLQRDPTKKTVYVIGSADVSKVELYRIDGEEETLLGTNDSPTSTFIYAFDNINVTLGDAVKAVAYDARENVIATDEIARTGEAYSLRLTPVTSDKGWKADGADIVMFDVEVLDANGNVCPLNYDKINFTYSGAGTYLGGYNGGMGSGCFQNSEDSAGISNYFGGAKDQSAVNGKDFVYAECGTNRIFVKSTRNAGTFTLNATLCDADGNPTAITTSASATSGAVAVTGGLTTEMPSSLTYTYAANAPEIESAPAMVSLSNIFDIDWTKVEKVEKVDNTVYYTVTLNGEELTLTPKAYEGPSNSVFAPIIPVLDELKKLGADITYSYDSENEELTVQIDGGYNAEDETSTGHTLRCNTKENQLYVDDGSNLPNDFPTLKDDVFCFELPMILSYVPNVATAQNITEHTFAIIYSSTAVTPTISVSGGGSGGKTTVKAENAPTNSVTYAVKYDESGRLTYVQSAKGGAEMELSFEPDKVFVWDANQNILATKNIEN